MVSDTNPYASPQFSGILPDSDVAFIPDAEGIRSLNRKKEASLKQNTLCLWGVFFCVRVIPFVMLATLHRLKTLLT